MECGERGGEGAEEGSGPGFSSMSPSRISSRGKGWAWATKSEEMREGGFLGGRRDVPSSGWVVVGGLW